MNEPQKVTILTGAATAPGRIGVGSWAIIAILVVLLAATGFVVYLGWILGSGAEVTTPGYVSMALGVVLSLAVGFGLMGLVFYSSRSGYDEPPVFITTVGDSAPKSSFENDSQSK